MPTLLTAGPVPEGTQDDFMLAQMLQLEYDREHDHKLLAEEKHFNKHSTGMSIIVWSFSLFKRLQLSTHCKLYLGVGWGSIKGVALPLTLFLTDGSDHLDRPLTPKFRGHGHVFPWANTFVGQGQSKFEAPVKKPRC